MQTRILVVDDHPATALTLSRAIAQLGDGIEVISETSGRAALDRVKDGAVDLVITDMMMPGMNGLELIENLKTHPGGQPAYTILVTAYDVPGLRESARRLGVNETIIKPVRPDVLCQTVGRALEKIKQPDHVKSEPRKISPFKILIADDAADNVSLLARYMQAEGYEYISAADGVETLEKTRSFQPDLILLDVNMPKMDGFKVLEEMRADPLIQHIPVIVLTAARIGYADLQIGLNLGADDYVVKPFDRRELFARIRTRLRIKEADDLIRLQNRELSVLPEIGRELSAVTDINALTDVILRRTVETLGALMGHILLLDPQGPLCREYHLNAAGAAAEQVQLPALHDLLAQIREGERGLILENTENDARWQTPKNDPTRSVILVPMLGRFDLMGLLVLSHERAGYFNQRHMNLLQAIASQAAIALENARLYARASRERQQLAVVLKSAADAILVFDAQGRLSMLNAAAEKLFTGEEVRVGLPLEAGRCHEGLINLLAEAYATDASRNGEIRWGDGRFFSAQVTPIAEGGCVAVLNDVSRYKALEHAKDEFISTATHDLKNPITSVLGYSRMLVQAGPLNAIQQDFASRIQSAADTMHQLVQDLLDLAQVDADVESARNEVDVDMLVAEVAAEFAPRIEASSQTLTLHRCADQPHVEGDARQLKQVFRNLVGNALKYTPAHGDIRLSVHADHEAVQVEVQDTGYGIPAADLPHIFDRFYRVREGAVRDIEGNGLGLAIVKSILEKHGGQVGVESEPGKGSRFTARLPLMNTCAVAAT